MKKYDYIRLININKYDGWDLVEIIPAKFENYYDMCVVCFDDVPKLEDIIKRQKAEIEQWKEEAKKYQSMWCEVVNDIPSVKAEAVKEFADKVLLYIPNIEGDTTIKCVEEAIKQTLKETVGDADGCKKM